MDRKKLLELLLEVRNVLDSSVSDTQVEKLTFGYLEGGYIDLGIPDLIRDQTFLNVTFIIIDKLRKEVIHGKESQITRGENSERAPEEETVPLHQ